MLSKLIQKVLKRFAWSSPYRREDVLFAQGQMYTRILQTSNLNISEISDAEFKIFSQWGEDGIIEYLIRSLDDVPQTFVEFGVEDYTESNTRFLLQNRNWRGLIVDADEAAINYIHNDRLYWRHDLTATARHITVDNVNRILASNGFTGDVGLLSIDIDGNDYWIWKAIDEISPAILVMEYNSVFGNQHPITVPYDPDFVRSDAHYSNLYFGASLPALVDLAREKGYQFIGTTSSGVNAFFIRDDYRSPVEPKTATTGYVESTLRESRNESGDLTYLSGDDRVDEIENQTVYNISTGELTKIHNLRPLIK